MIYARVLVNLPAHHRSIRIPKGLRAESLGVWLLALLWTRENERDGFCSLDALDQIAREEIVEELLRVRLFAREVDEDGVHGVRVLKYELYNETKSQIESRRSWDRKRKKLDRTPSGSQTESRRTAKSLPPRHDKKRPEGQTSDSVGTLTGVPLPSGSEISPSPSLSSPDLDREGSGLRGVPGGVPSDSSRYLRLADRLTPELTEIAAGANGSRPIVDVATCWSKFKGRHADKWIHVAGEWQAWCASWGKNERADAERERAKSEESRAAADERASEVRKREVARDREYAELERDAVPAPVGDLLKAVGGKPK